MTKGNRCPRSFAFRLTEADGERLDAVAAAHDTTPGEWARAVVSRAAGLAHERRLMQRRYIDAAMIRAALAEFNRQGNNLNQIARRLNSAPALDGWDALGALELVRVGHHAALVAVLDALGVERNP